MNGAAWSVADAIGTAAELHAWRPAQPVTRLVRRCTVTRPAVVLGSLQRDAVSADVDVVRRRSGGGAVWVEPDDPLWVDVVVPAGDPLWDDDVGRAFGWLGRCWADALAACGVAGATVHDGALVRTPLSDRVCFAGLGPGEVTVGERKVVGLAQRRTRALAWFQCAVPRQWSPEPLAAALGLDADALIEVAMGSGVQSDHLFQRFTSRLRIFESEA